MPNQWQGRGRRKTVFEVIHWSIGSVVSIIYVRHFFACAMKLSVMHTCVNGCNMLGSYIIIPVLGQYQRKKNLLR